jgi:phosphoserine phosphatase
LMNGKGIAFLDIDKTIYDGYLIFPLAAHFLAGGIVKRASVDLLYQDLSLYRSGQIDYETTIENFNTHFAGGLKGSSPDSVLRAAKTLLETTEGRNFFPFVGPLMELLKNRHDIYLVTGELQFVGQAVADRFSVAGYVSSEMEAKDGVFTGDVGRSLARREGKSAAIEHLLKTYPRQNSMAFGDSEGDIDMLSKVEHAFCINATEGLAEVASIRRWNMVTPSSVLEAVRCAVTDY